MADDLRQIADLTRAARVGEIPGPDIYYAALMAGPSFFTDPRTHETTRGGAVAGSTPWMRAITPETDLKIAVAEAHGTGATAIKTMRICPRILSPPLRRRHTARACWFGPMRLYSRRLRRK